MAKRVLFFSCEPGGAEVLIPVIKLLKSNSYEVTVVSYGHAALRFKEKDIAYVEIGKINDNDFTLFEKFKPDLVISSATSLPHKDMSEKYLWKNTKERGIKTIAFLDQWQNYTVRFSGPAQNERLKYIPDYVNCINDIGKKEMIADGFNQNILLTFGHPYLSTLVKDAQKTDIKAIKEYLQIKETQKVFLFISEALKENYGATLGYDQYAVLDFFLENMQKVQNATIIIKLHPKDDISKFKDTISKYKNLSLRLISNEISPLKCILVSEYVYGMTSIMLIEAYILKKKVISLQPNLMVNDPLLLSREGYISRISTYENFDVLNGLYVENKKFDIQFSENGFLNFISNLFEN